MAKRNLLILVIAIGVFLQVLLTNCGLSLRSSYVPPCCCSEPLLLAQRTPVDSSENAVVYGFVVHNDCSKYGKDTPVEGSSISFEHKDGRQWSTTTTAKGTFDMSIPEGVYSISFNHPAEDQLILHKIKVSRGFSYELNARLSDIKAQQSTDVYIYKKGEFKHK